MALCKFLSIQEARIPILLVPPTQGYILRDKTVTSKKNASNSRDRYNWKNPVYHQKSNVNSVFAVFNGDFESHTKYISLCINNYPVRFQILLLILVDAMFRSVSNGSCHV